MDRLALCRWTQIITLLGLSLELSSGLFPCRALAATQSESVRLYLDQGASLLRQGDLRAAEDTARKAIQRNPFSAEAHHLLGVVLLRARKPADAAEAFLQAIKLNPAYSKAMNDLAEVYILLGKEAEAEHTLTRAIEVDLKQADPYLSLAKLYEQRRDVPAAIKMYQGLLAIQPAHADALFALATLQDHAGETKAAAETLARLTKAHPKHADAWYVTGRMAEKRNDLVEAAYAYKQAVAKFDAVHHLTKEIAPDQIELALTADDVRRINKAGKKVALIGVENAYSLGTDLSRIKEFYDRGARYMSLAHNGHSQLSDSNTGERDGVWMHNGLSALGRQVIAEMNRLGMMV